MVTGELREKLKLEVLVKETTVDLTVSSQKSIVMCYTRVSKFTVSEMVALNGIKSALHRFFIRRNFIPYLPSQYCN